MTTDNSLATKEQPKSPLAIASNQIRDLVSSNRLTLPADYAYENALKEAWLIIEQDPKLKGCTDLSKVQALQYMVYRAFSPSKKQCYFIPYDNKLSCQSSYMGEIALAKRIDPFREIYGDVIREGDQFVPAKVWSNSRGWITVIEKHAPAWPKSGEIIGVYVGSVDKETNEDLGIELMTMEQVQTSWKKSKTYKPGQASPHTEFPDQMALRTCSRRWTKPIIATSTDSYLLEAVRESDMDAIDAEVVEDHDANANKEMLSIEATPVEDSTIIGGEVKEAIEEVRAKVEEAKVAEETKEKTTPAPNDKPTLESQPSLDDELPPGFGDQ